MRAINHVLTGVLIGASITQPAIALTAAVASHFALDALPHSGGNNHVTKKFLIGLFFDGFLALVVLLVIFQRKPHDWLLMIICGCLAASPDLMWLPRYIKELKVGHVIKKPMNIVNRFHSKIQWGERPYFMWIEVAWATLIITILVSLKKI